MGEALPLLAQTWQSFWLRSLGRVRAHLTT